MVEEVANIADIGVARGHDDVEDELLLDEEAEFSLLKKIALPKV